MPRAIWSGSISFGLVNVPVKLYSAVSEKGVKFHQLEEGTGSRIRYKRVSEESGEEVPYEHIVKGYEVSKGQFVTLTDEDLEAVEPEGTRVIDLEDFIALDEIDPIYFDRTYWLEPDGKGAAKAYALLVQAMERSGRVAIGRFVMRSKQYLACVRPIDGVLSIETMHFPDEIVDRSFVDAPPKDSVTDRELTAAEQLIDSLTSDWDPDRYHDTYREQVLDIINRKAEGEDIVVRKSTEEKAEVIDLMSALEASLRDRKSGTGSKGSTKRSSLDGLSKSELYEKAQEAGIEGRSQMSKDELIDALKESA